MSNLVEHARRELALVGEEEWITEGIVKVVQAFADMGHSGSSAEFTADILDKLLRYRPLSPITSNPDEWIDQSAISGYPLWQNKRDSTAFSSDGGKTWKLLEEAAA